MYVFLHQRKATYSLNRTSYIRTSVGDSPTTEYDQAIWILLGASCGTYALQAKMIPSLITVQNLQIDTFIPNNFFRLHLNALCVLSMLPEGMNAFCGCL